jgi:cell division septal protein FtsQ
MKRVRRYLVLLVVIILVFGGGYFAFNKIKIQKITCRSQFGECDSELKSQIANFHKGDVFQTKESLDSMLVADKNVSKYEINFLLPFNFEVNVIEREPIVAFVKNDGGFALVDSQGQIVDNAAETNLPRIVSYSTLDTQQIMYIANLVNRIYNFFGSTTARVSADGIEIPNIKGKDVIFPLQGDQDVLLGSLTLILSRLPTTPEATTIRVIDLRFKNPVLR